MEIRRVFNKNTCLVLLGIVAVSMLFYYMEFRNSIKQEEYYAGMAKHYEKYKDSEEPVLNTIRVFYGENSEDVKKHKVEYSLARKQLESRINYAIGTGKLKITKLMEYPYAGYKY